MSREIKQDHQQQYCDWYICLRAAVTMLDTLWPPVLHPTAQRHLCYTEVPHGSSSKVHLKVPPHRAALKLRTGGDAGGELLIRKVHHNGTSGTSSIF